MKLKLPEQKLDDEIFAMLLDLRALQDRIRVLKYLVSDELFGISNGDWQMGWTTAVAELELTIRLQLPST